MVYHTQMMVFIRLSRTHCAQIVVTEAGGRCEPIPQSYHGFETIKTQSGHTEESCQLQGVRRG